MEMRNSVVRLTYVKRFVELVSIHFPLLFALVSMLQLQHGTAAERGLHILKLCKSLLSSPRNWYVPSTCIPND